MMNDLLNFVLKIIYKNIKEFKKCLICERECRVKHVPLCMLILQTFYVHYIISLSVRTESTSSFKHHNFEVKTLKTKQEGAESAGCLLSNQ